MEIRRPRPEEADEACRVIRRSIAELCHADHHGDAPTLALWLANKTADNMRRWIEQRHVLVAADDGAILGVAAMTDAGEVILNYVSPDARFRGVSKALIAGLEAMAVQLGCDAVTLKSTATARRYYLAAGYAQTGPPEAGFGRTLGYPMMKRL
jgi:GNAT superfamily N-acetyltransferase